MLPLLGWSSPLHTVSLPNKIDSRFSSLHHERCNSMQWLKTAMRVRFISLPLLPESFSPDDPLRSISGANATLGHSCRCRFSFVDHGSPEAGGERFTDEMRRHFVLNRHPPTVESFEKTATRFTIIRHEIEYSVVLGTITVVSICLVLRKHV